MKFQNLGEIFSCDPRKDGKRKSQADDKKTGKKAANSYLLFCKERRTALHAENPDISSREVTKMLAQEWKNLSNEEKQKYEKQKEEALKTQEVNDFITERTIYLQVKTMDGQVLAIPAIPIKEK